VPAFACHACKSAGKDGLELAAYGVRFTDNGLNFAAWGLKLNLPRCPEASRNGVPVPGYSWLPPTCVNSLGRTRHEADSAAASARVF
jgi:hypothetical protein